MAAICDICDDLYAAPVGVIAEYDSLSDSDSKDEAEYSSSSHDSDDEGLHGWEDVPHGVDEERSEHSEHDAVVDDVHPESVGILETLCCQRLLSFVHVGVVKVTQFVQSVIPLTTRICQAYPLTAA